MELLRSAESKVFCVLILTALLVGVGLGSLMTRSTGAKVVPVPSPVFDDFETGAGVQSINFIEEVSVIQRNLVNASGTNYNTSLSKMGYLKGAICSTVTDYSRGYPVNNTNVSVVVWDWNASGVFLDVYNGTVDNSTVWLDINRFVTDEAVLSFEHSGGGTTNGSSVNVSNYARCRLFVQTQGISTG